ncbi:MAG: ABC transporter ATP-binding protein [Spirochaetota bacterium]
MIEVNELSRRYGPLVAVDRVSFAVRPGEAVGLLGPNGAGKTTIMKALTGYHYPHGGSARVCGIDVEEDPAGAKRRLGYLPEDAPAYADLTVAEYLEFACGVRGIVGPASRTARERVVEIASLGKVLRRPISELSQGYRQRVALAQALVHEPQVVVLDEPTSGLDPNQIVEFRGIVRDLARDRAVLLSTHVLREVEAVCDRVLILDEGRLVASGTADEIGRELAGRTVVAVEFASRLSARALAELAELGEVIDVDRERPAAGGGGPSGGSLVRIALPEGCSGETVFDWAVARSLRIRSLVPERYSLEDLFGRLTGGGER